MCIGTSDYPLEIPTFMSTNNTSRHDMSIDATTQTTNQAQDSQKIEIVSHATTSATVTTGPQTTSSMPNFMTSLMEPPVLNKIVNIANKRLNRTVQPKTGKIE